MLRYHVKSNSTCPLGSCGRPRHVSDKKKSSPCHVTRTEESDRLLKNKSTLHNSHYKYFQGHVTHEYGMETKMNKNCARCVLIFASVSQVVLFSFPCVSPCLSLVTFQHELSHPWQTSSTFTGHSRDHLGPHKLPALRASCVGPLCGSSAGSRNWSPSAPRHTQATAFAMAGLWPAQTTKPDNSNK